jgi:PKD repeat protein
MMGNNQRYRTWSFILAFMISLLAGTSIGLFAQIDDEFWFVVPELSYRSSTGGTPGTMRIATMELEATVTISMPANAYNPSTNPNGFRDTTFTIPGNSSVGINLDHLIDVAGNPTNNRLENKPLTVDGINDFGLYITATNMITAYWEVNYDLGSDLWTLKGGNALGTLFYTPFQEIYPNRTLTPRAYSAIDVVATVDNTQVTFTLPPGKQASYGSAATDVTTGTHTVILDRGQTFSLYPLDFSTDPAFRLGGTRIEATDSIAVTVKDDALATPPNGQDVIGDQLVPVDITGDHYIVPEVGNPNHVYVVATEDNTTIYMLGTDNLPLPGSPFGPLNAGEQQLIIVPGGVKMARLTSKQDPSDPYKPFYVFQLGTENKSRGGAIIPAIGCTGNTQLSFTRARDDNKFYFFIIVEKGNEDKFFIDGDPQDGTVTPQIIDPGQFIDIQGSGGYVAWFSGSINSNVLTPGQHLVKNTGGIFHLGIMNGFPGQGLLYYGYYSDFGGLNIGANVAGTRSSAVRACYGNPVQLYAYGGTEYSWTPDAYLDDATSNLPIAYNLPPGAHTYTVTVGGACNTGSVDLDIIVAPPVEAHFVTNEASGCSPLDIILDDQSSGVYTWRYNLGGGTPDIIYDLNDKTPYPPPPGYPNPFSLTTTYTNTGYDPIYDTISLLVNNSSGCSDQLKKTIITFPEIHSSFSIPGGINRGCDPFEVQFQNNSSGDTATYLWEFGDGATSIEKEPAHIFRNLFDPDDLVFETRLIATSDDYCRDTTVFNIIVSPYIEAKFAFDSVFACTPHEVRITDQSVGADTYLWDFGDGTTSTSPGPEVTKLYVNNLPVPDTFQIHLRVDNEEGCFDEIQREVTIFPELDADFQAIPTEGCSPFEVFFQNNSTGAATYFWDFGDGGTSTGTNPTHLYDRSLIDHDTTFTVTLVATSSELCRDTATLDILVHPYIEAAFTADDVVGCHPFTVIFNNQSIGVDQYFWNFGDGSPVSNNPAASLSHTFLNTTTATVVFTVQLVVLNSQGCRDTLEKKITVHPEMTANFVMDKNSGCHPLTVTFTDQSLNASEYYWDFGDGASSTLPSPVHTFTNFGDTDSVYTVTLFTYSDDGECVKSLSRTVTVSGHVEAEFTFPKKLDCTPFNLSFENLSVGGDSYTWDFGDGTVTTVGTTDPVSHTFVNPDFVNTLDFQVSLTVENYANCVDQVTKTISVYPDIQTGFTPTVTEGCHPLRVGFTSTTSGGYRYLWDFGDGSTSSLENPVYTFNNTGAIDSVFTVKLVSIASNNICSDSSEMDITVFPYVRANFSTPEFIGCNPFDVTIENSSVNASTYRWDFGDGTDTVTFNTNPILHRYYNTDFVNQQPYEITLEAENNSGCTHQIRRTITVQPDIHAEFSASQVQGCHPLTVNFTDLSSGAATYHWDFGNGNTSKSANPSQTFTNIGLADSTYRVWLYVWASNNVCQDSFSMNITVHPLVSADFAIQYNEQCTPAEVVFTNSSVNGQQFDWIFNGDPLTTTSTDPITRQFINPSTTTAAYYPVELTVTSPQGCTSSLSKQVTVHHDIVAGFSNITEGCQPLQVSFTNSSLGASLYQWDFGDNASSILESPVHIYTNFSNYDSILMARLVVTSGNLCRDTAYSQITVYPVPKAKFSVNEIVDCSPLEVSIENLSEAGDLYVWDFGDGTTPVDTTGIGTHYHSYTNDQPGVAVHVLKLYAETLNGCKDSVTQNMTVYPSVDVGFERDSAGCSPYTSRFTNSSQRAINYIWDFGDGTIGYINEPGHTFVNEGVNDTVFNVEMRGYSIYGCEDSITKQVTVYPSPVAKFDYNPIYQYFPSATVTLVNETSPGTFDYEWIFDDGNTSDLKDPGSYTYDHWGEYNIQLNVSNPQCTDSVVHWIKIFPPQPIAAFVPNIDTGCVPLVVSFTNNSVYADEYFWEFDDGGTSTDFEPTHTFEQAGYYQVKLTVRGEGGEDFAFQEIRVFILPEPDFLVEPDLVMLPDQPAKTFNFTKHGTRFLWDMGDGTMYDVKDTVHQYTEIGIYDVSLRAWTDKGCEAFLEIPEAVEVIGKGTVIYPNAFAPSVSGPSGGYYNPQDVSNEIFFPYHDGVMEYQLYIYNRWGELVFETNDVNQGWDGYCGSERCTEGVYVWKVEVEYSNGKREVLVGDVTLLHKRE